VAAAVVADHETGVTAFYKLTGSGNDFVFIDARETGVGALADPARVRALCARGTGVGADGVVFLEADPGADLRIRYVNSDGSPAALCGNATLCTVRLAEWLGIGALTHLRIATDSGVVDGRLAAGVPEFDVGPVERLTRDAPVGVAGGERRVGYALVGVPHLVVAVDDLTAIDLTGRGRALRAHPWTGVAGANVNFIAPEPSTSGKGGWGMRTYERGVEGETLACGTGAVASAALVVAWGRDAGPCVRIWTRSGEPLDVMVRAGRGGEEWSASLRGEGRLVFRGELVDL